MKKSIVLSILCGASALLFTGCEVEPEPLTIQHTNTVWPDKGEEYYASLRAWKATRPEFGFGWFSATTGKASLQGQMRNIPDSIGIISIWGGLDPVNNPSQAEDMKFFQEVLGTKIIKTHLLESSFDLKDDGDKTELQKMQEQWGWDDGELRPNDRNVAVTPAQEEAIRKYARSLAESVVELGYDGMDIDHEPNVGGGTKPYVLGGYYNRMFIFFDEMSKYFGPKSGTDRLLAIDGEYYAYILPEIGPMLDYVISQAYNCSFFGDSTRNNSLDYRIKRLYDTFPQMSRKELAAKFIVAENFESYAAPGGNTGYTNRDGSKDVSAVGMAKWKPLVDGVEVRKGGAGTYHMEYEFNVYGDYKWLRQMINIMGKEDNSSNN